jgi:hypothetical protein
MLRGPRLDRGSGKYEAREALLSGDLRMNELRRQACGSSLTGLARHSPTHQPQLAFFDHVYAVVDAGTAEEIPRCDYLRGFGRFEVGTTVADGETWTGRYLSGRTTYVEAIGRSTLTVGPTAAQSGSSTTDALRVRTRLSNGRHITASPTIGWPLTAAVTIEMVDERAHVLARRAVRRGQGRLCRMLRAGPMSTGSGRSRVATASASTAAAPSLSSLEARSPAENLLGSMRWATLRG